MERLLRLEDERARDPAVVGGKAAGLARAASAGLPVMPGWVLPVGEGDQALSEWARVVGRSSAAISLAIAEAPLAPAVRGDLGVLAALLGSGAIVRSSAVQEADPIWAGAFATYVDVAPHDLETAVRGCWASAFSRDVLARCDAVGLDPGALRIAVLIQPWVSFDAGGIALLQPDGSVRVAVAEGPPAEIVAGRARGTSALVTREAEIVAGREAPVSQRVLRAVATLARESGGDSIEWGCVGEDVSLLQVRSTPTPPARSTRPLEHPRRPLPPDAERVAAIAARFPGPLADRLVMPWALAPAPSPVPTGGALPVADAAAALGEASELAGDLAAWAWGLPRALAAREAAETLRSILGPDPTPALWRLSGLRPVGSVPAARLLGLVRGIARTLVERGFLAAEELVWRLSIEELARAIDPAGPRPPERHGPGRWDPFVFAVVSGSGRPFHGESASGGIGAGRIRVLDGSADAWRGGGRDVLAVTQPVPQVAPLLWNAAGLVASRGSVGAHLFEVARSLGVPAVIGVDLGADADGSLAAVDGDAGSAFVLTDRVRPAAEVGA